MKESSFFTSLLQIAFIVLKLCKVIDWSWWWVMSPCWIPLGLLVIVLAFMGLIKSEEEKPKESLWQQKLKAMKEKQKTEDN